MAGPSARPVAKPLTKKQKERVEEQRGVPWFNETKPLSQAEAQAAHKALMAAFQRLWPLLDDGIALSSHGRHEVIWGNIDQEETRAIVDRIIKSGLFSPAAAQAVRGMVTIWNEFQWMLVTGPRFRQTFSHYLREGFGFDIRPIAYNIPVQPEEPVRPASPSVNVWRPPL